MKLKNVKKYREKKVWTQQQLAEKAGVSKPTVIAAEKGREVGIVTVQKLIKALGVDPAMLT